MGHVDQHRLTVSDPIRAQFTAGCDVWIPPRQDGKCTCGWLTSTELVDDIREAWNLHIWQWGGREDFWVP